MTFFDGLTGAGLGVGAPSHRREPSVRFPRACYWRANVSLAKTSFDAFAREQPTWTAVPTRHSLLGRWADLLESDSEGPSSPLHTDRAVVIVRRQRQAQTVIGYVACRS